MHGGAALRCAALASTLDHRDANASVMKFDVLYIRQARRSQPPVIEAAAIHLHGYMLPVAEVMLQLVHWKHLNSPLGHDWFNKAVARLPIDKPATPTHHQCLQFHEYALRHNKIILHDNAHPHVAVPVKNYLKTVDREVLPHSPYSPDIALSNYHLFWSMTHGLSEQRFTSYEDTKIRLIRG
ncbi:Mariner Mos1 transposase [Eumeta japonica]|uniref:Mariner Mos1 transposase n=1 Tax=Eumeta variegata TaxID=151549 RepID=A0A4C1WR22_EUMVA|nr:Mariner Mos1 transposase [Eumeta japonica]